VRVYAIGDVHGRLDLFDALMARLKADHGGRAPARAHIIGLGDYVDRGDHSKQLLDRLAEGPPAWAEWTLIRGNHEQTFLDILTLADRARILALVPNWLNYGGRELLTSYGAGAALAYGDDYVRIVNFIRGATPVRHARLLAAMPFRVEIGDYLFVHAGVRPGVPLAEQSTEDLLWIRDEFLDSTEDFGAVVVHGHTPATGPELRPNRINLDTGAYVSGTLTAVALEGEERRIITSRG